MNGAQMREAIGAIQRATSLLLEKELAYNDNALSEREEMLLNQHREHFRVTISTAIVSALRDISEDGHRHRYVDAVQAIFEKIASKLSESADL